MKTLAGVLAGVAGLAALWHVLALLSSDAVGLALGVLFGVLASLPAAALVMAARARQAYDGPPTVRHEHTHRLDRADLDAAYRAGLADGQAMAAGRVLVDGAQVVRP